MDTICAAVIGSGFIAGVHEDALRRLGVPVVGLLTRDARAARARGGGRRVYDTLDELCADGEVDVVHVTSPNSAHHEQVLALLRAGKHVVCEKPLATTSAGGAELLAAARAAGVVHAVCFNLRFYPLVHEARARVARGDIGTPTLVTGSYLQDWLLLDTDWNWRLDPAAAGDLRAVADIGSHWLDLVRFVSGAAIAAVMAELRTVVPVRQRPAGPVLTFTADAVGDVPREPVTVTSEDTASLLLRLTGGLGGAVTVSQVSAGRRNACSYELSGTEGTLSWNSEDPERLWIGRRGAPNEVLLRDPAQLTTAAAAVTHHPGGHAEGFPDTFRGLFERVYEDVRAGRPAAEPAYPTFADGYEGLLVEDAVSTSRRTGGWAPVDRRTS